MTTIVYRDGVLAADTGMSVGCSQFSHMVKIVRNERGDLAGGCGLAPWCAAFLRWFTAGEIGDAPVITRENDDETAKGFIVRATGEMFVFESGGSFSPVAKYYTIGSGRNHALGALFMGASSEQAVRAAIEHDDATFGDVTVLRHEAG